MSGLARLRALWQRGTGARGRRGLVMIGLTLLIYWSALNRGQPLLWLIAAVLLAAVVTGYAWPRWSMRALHVGRGEDLQAHEGKPITLHLEVANTGWLPRYLVTVADRLPTVAADGRIVMAERSLGLIGSLAPHERRAFQAEIMCEKRGAYHLGPARLATSFPLDLITASHRADDSGHELVVYPALFPIAHLPLGGHPLRSGDILLPEAAGSVEFKGLREYRYGDNPRHIHWPSSAKGDDLLVREFEALTGASLVLLLDLDRHANRGHGRQASAEYAIRIVASVADHATRLNLPYTLRGEAAASLDLPMAQGHLHLEQTLDALARLDIDGTTPLPQLLEDVAHTCQHGDTVLVCITLPHPAGFAVAAALAAIRGKGAHLLAILLDGASFEHPGHPSASLYDDPTASGLLALGIRPFQVRCGDDLSLTFTT